MPLKRTAFLALVVLVGTRFAAAADTNGDGLETILVPFDVALTATRSGLDGSSWTGQLFLHNGSNGEINLAALTGCIVTCAAYIYPAGFTGEIPGPQRPSDRGVLFAVPAEAASQVTFAGRFYESSQRAQPIGVAIPIVREGQYLHGTKYLLFVPGGTNARVALRLYDPRREHNRIAQTNIRVELVRPGADGADTVFASTTVTTTSQNDAPPIAPGFAVIYDLAGLFPQIENVPWFHIRLTPTEPDAEYWALASATDNATQTVVLITPG